MKNRSIAILKNVVTVILFSPVINQALAQTSAEKQTITKDTAAIKKDTTGKKPALLNQSVWLYDTDLYHSKNPELTVKNSEYQLPRNKTSDSAQRAGANFIIRQPVVVSVPDLTTEQPEGRFSGWIGYTTSRTENPFDRSNDFNWFPTVQDRIHDFSLVGTYRFTDRFIFSGNLIQSNGNLVYGSSGYAYNSYESNNVRFDFSATIQGQPHRNFRNSWSLGIYDLNGYWNSGASGPGVVENKILPKPVPSVSWNLKFH